VIDGVVNAVPVVVQFVANIDGAIDRYLIDGAVNAVGATGLRIGKSFRSLQTGRIQHYLYAAMAGAMLVIGINYLIRAV
jgi:NADH-quinone oxidoreductase subunit L